MINLKKLAIASAVVLVFGGGTSLIAFAIVKAPWVGIAGMAALAIALVYRSLED
jgi:hypothetical protein